MCFQGGEPLPLPAMTTGQGPPAPVLGALKEIISAICLHPGAPHPPPQRDGQHNRQNLTTDITIRLSGVPNRLSWNGTSRVALRRSTPDPKTTVVSQNGSAITSLCT